MAYQSIVDYLNASKQKSDFGSRSKLAAQYGIKNYSGTAQQNTQLLGFMQAKKPAASTPVSKPISPVSKPVTPAPKPVAPVPQSWQQSIQNGPAVGYNGALNGENTRLSYNGKVIDTRDSKIISEILSNGGRIEQSNAFANAPKNMSLQDLSIAALSGDTNAQNFLKQYGVQAMSGKNLWNGLNVDKEMFDAKGQAFRAAYVKDNPYSDITKQYEMNNYNAMSDWIKNNKAMPDYQVEAYKKLVDKWNLEDFNNPFVQQQHQLESDKKSALESQDVALNNTMRNMDTNNFQQFQALQQQMSDRGMSDSGIAADAYMRSQMAANANYADAFSNAATTKSDLQTKFNDAISQSKIGQQQYADEDFARQQELAQKQAEADQQFSVDLMKQQTEQDKYLTSATGNVYFNGKVITQNGRPVTSLEYQKMTETQRHNLASENNVAVGNQIKYQDMQNDYNLGLDKNAIARQKLAADIQIATNKMKLDYAKLDFNYQKLSDNNKIAQDKLNVAIANTSNSATKAQLSALGKQSADLAKQITAYQKKGDKPPKSIVDKYNQVNNAISALVGGPSFNSSTGGGGASYTLGSLSKKYESGSSGAATISSGKGDVGGKSYGTYQIASKTGTMNSFLNYLKSAEPSMYKALSKYSIGSSGFDNTWKSLAKNSAFETIQHEFIKKSHYTPVVDHIKRNVGFDVNQRSSALRNAIWSLGVQHGIGGAARVIKNSGITSKMSDKEIITRLYNERMKVDTYFSSSPASTKASVKRRFASELKDALAMLG